MVYNRNRVMVIPALVILLIVSQSCVFAQRTSNLQLLSAGGLVSAIPTANLGRLNNRLLGGITALCEVGGERYGASAGRIVQLDGTGGGVRTIPIAIQKLGGIAPLAGSAMIIGDSGRNSLHKLDVQTGKLTEFLALSRVNAAGFPAGSVIRSGQLSGVASDGSNVYVSYNAGFSSSIFKIDPITAKVIAHDWSPGPDTTALACMENGLAALSRDGREIRPYTTRLKQTFEAVPVQVLSPSGLIVRGRDIEVLSPSTQSIIRLQATRAIVAAVNPDAYRLRIPSIRKVLPSLNRKYAFLVCGALADSGFWYDPAWNDTLWMYKMLLAAGFHKDNVYVLYGNGTDFVSANPNYRYPEQVTDFPATRYYVDKVLNGMANGDAASGIAKLTTNDKLFVWTFGHGAGGNPVSLCLYDTWYDAASLSAKFNAIPCSKRAIFMQQCHSGGFIPYLRRADTIISTACAAGGVAYTSQSPAKIEHYGGADFHHCAFNFDVISSLDRRDPFGAAVNADTSGDSLCSALEAAVWHANHPDATCAEVPQTDNMGGIGASYQVNN